MIPGFERELMGAKTGDKVEFTLTPEDAYGPHNPDAVQEVPLEMFGGIEPEIGMTLMSDLGPFKVAGIDGGLIKADFNHALAGKSLTFNVRLSKLERLLSPKFHTVMCTWTRWSSALRWFV